MDYAASFLLPYPLRNTVRRTEASRHPHWHFLLPPRDEANSGKKRWGQTLSMKAQQEDGLPPHVSLAPTHKLGPYLASCYARVHIFPGTLGSRQEASHLLPQHHSEKTAQKSRILLLLTRASSATRTTESKLQNPNIVSWPGNSTGNTNYSALGTVLSPSQRLCHESLSILPEVLFLSPLS